MITLPYFGLLITSLILYWLIPRQWLRNIILIVASYTFLYLVDKWSIAVVSGLTLFSYLFGWLIYRHPKKPYIHIIGVIGVLTALVLFKYLGFLTGIVNSLSSFIAGLPNFEIKKLLLPLGISYIVFKHISYLTDIKWGLVKPGRFIDFLLYSSIFTIFVAGPIERFERFKPQVEQHRIPFSWNNIDYGFMRIVFGLFKKLVLADWIGYFINPVWQNPQQYSSWVGLLALVGYSFQIYFDFAGYSDIAIGSSKLFGIKIMENFNNPYLAPNISQFWRRWHISLSDWIRDYLFFPLSKLSNKKVWLMFFVPVIAMALCGLWHGERLRFIIWGVWHGVGLFIYQFYRQKTRNRKKSTNMYGSPIIERIYWGEIVTFSFVSYGWILFHVSSKKIIYDYGVNWVLLLLIPLSILVIVTLKELVNILSNIANSDAIMKSSLSFYLLIAVALLCCSWTGEFILLLLPC